jgi:Dyp-type peroxidase family
LAAAGDALSFADIQGGVLTGYRPTHARFVFAQVRDGDAARRWMADRLEDVTFEGGWKPEHGAHTLNIALSHRGLLALGVPRAHLSGLKAFGEGMPARACILGDEGPSAPAEWHPRIRDPDTLITLSGWDRATVEQATAQLHGELAAPGSGFALGAVQIAAPLADDQEHFGFADGFSQPAIAGAATGPRVGEGVLTRWRFWRKLAAGEFILGRQDEGGLQAPAPAGPLGVEATFMVVRKLEQDVAGFRAYIARQGLETGRGADWIAARMIGRWYNGSPLAAHPASPGPPPDPGARSINDFRYGDDPAGGSCPLGAHVRRAHPRDGLGWQGRLSMRHRLIRRGISYGPPLEPGATDSEERGLMFVCFCASLERQFEFVQKQWLSDGNVFGLGGDDDPVVGGRASSDTMVIQREQPLYLRGLPRFVTTRGGEYFLLPGRTGLRALADGHW